MKRMATALVLVLLAAVAVGQELEVSIENTTAKTVTRTKSQTEFTVGDQVQITPGAETVSDPVLKPVVLLKVTSPVPQTRIKCRTAVVSELEPGLFMVSDPGEHLVEVLSIGLIEGELFFDEREVRITVPGVPVPPPDDDEDEDDQDDEDPPTPAPIPEPGLRVMVIYETADVPNYPATQVGILTSQSVKKWLDANCTVGPDGVTPEWRFVDDDSVFDDPESVWAKAIKRDRESLPWVIISDGTKGHEGPLPMDAAGMLDLLKGFKNG